MSRATRLLNACRQRDVDTAPIWLMRQAGRYMPEYRKLRDSYSLLDLIKTPSLATEVTLQPINAFDLDAAIIFSDILPLLDGMGLELEFIKGDGPRFSNPIRTDDDIHSLAEPPAAEIMQFTLEAIKLVRQELDGLVPLIGFSGAPFTLASYAIEGQSSRSFSRVKACLRDNHRGWRILMEKLSRIIADYLKSQIQSGAQIVQLFDSWVEALSPDEFRTFALPYINFIINDVKNTYSDIPLIYFGTNTAPFLHDLKDINADVIGVDWRIDIDEAWTILGDHFSIQGNLDPKILLTNPSEIEIHTRRILEQTNMKKGYIFNLGHGIIKETPVENVSALINFVHDHGRSS